VAKIPLGLQLYSVRENCAEDLPGTLKAVAEMGYDGVEFAGYYDYPAEELRKMLDDNGLTCCGSHLGIDTFSDENFQATVDFNLTLGNPYLICPGLPGQYTESRQAWQQTAQLFNALTEKARYQNVWVGYHNHHTEFTDLDGEMPWDTFFGNTEMDVIMQLDTGNALHGGADVVPFLERYPGRALTVHLKPYSATAGADDPHAGFRPLIGDDEIPWDKLFKLCETTGGTRWYIVEYESDLFPPMESVERTVKILRDMGK